MKTLVFRGGKFSFFLLMLFLIPIFLETDILLRIWLKNVPEYAGVFTKLIVVCSIIGSFGATMSTAIQATGKIEYYQIITGGVLLLAFPITYICYKLRMSPAVAYVGLITMNTVAIFTRMFFLKKYLDIAINEYSTKVLWIAFIVFVFSFIPPFYVHENMNEGFLRLIVVTCVSLLSSTAFVYVFGLTTEERKPVIRFIRNKLLKR
jgi:hypothetical protein